MAGTSGSPDGVSHRDSEISSGSLAKLDALGHVIRQCVRQALTRAACERALRLRTLGPAKPAVQSRSHTEAQVARHERRQIQRGIIGTLVHARSPNGLADETCPLVEA